MRITNEKLEQTILNIINQEDSPRMKFGGIKKRSCKEKGRNKLNKKEERVWVILT